MAVFTDEQLAIIASEIEKQNNTLYKFVAKYATNSWAKLQAIVKTGRASEFFEIGDEFVCNYNYQGTDYDWTWVCADFRDVTLESGAVVNGMVLQSKYCSIESIVFDLPEQVEADEEIAQEGVFYYGLTGSTVSIANLTLLSLNVGDSIPYSSYNKIFKTSVYDTSKGILVSGYSRYKFSAVRKWLNSDADVGEDWFGQLDHVGQVKPTDALTLAGFMHGLDEDFLAIINPTKIQVATNEPTDGGVTDVMYDKFWLPSVEEVYGVPKATGIEGAYLPYWKNRTELTAPSDGRTDGRRINSISDATWRAYFLRSCHAGSGIGGYYTLVEGAISFGGVNTKRQLAPCCVIC